MLNAVSPGEDHFRVDSNTSLQRTVFVSSIHFRQLSTQHALQARCHRSGLPVVRSPLGQSTRQCRVG